ncbi:MAG: hypothetical protein PF961_16995 [Planctomycetota bacterium]|jgi:hypothetical protein|nr:hypothetical protein [Planctomycetota bacterium]
MTAAALIEAPASPVVWETRRPPAPAVRIISWVAGLIFGILGAALLNALMLEPDWRISIAVGCALGVLIPLGVGHGARARVHATGELVYGFGRHPNVVIPLSAISSWRMLSAGMTRGIGIEVGREQVHFTSRKGISYATMDRCRRLLQVDLLLEFLTEDDLVALQTRQEQNAQLSADAPALSASTSTEPAS